MGLAVSLGGLVLVGLLASGPRPLTDAEAALTHALTQRGVETRASTLTWSLALPHRHLGGRGHALVGADGRFALSFADPVGLTPLLRVRSDGVALAVTVADSRQHWLATDAEAVLQDVSRTGLTDLLALALRRLPLGVESLREVRRIESGWWTRWSWRSQVLVVEMEADGRPRRARVLDSAGVPQASLTWSPDAIELRAIEPAAAVRLSGLAWEPSDATSAAFVLDAPEGFVSAPLEHALQDVRLSWLVRELGPRPD